MAKIDLLNIMKSKQVDPIKFQFDIMQIPPISYFLSNQDIADLRAIATSLRLSAKIDVKRKMMDEIMRRRGFKRFQAGTNRIIYKFEESQAFVAKVAIDRVGMKDNPNEFKNQELLKPFVTKTFHVSECGTVALSERVEPIVRPSEFEIIAEDIYELITNKILGIYVMEDIGTKYFMNWGTRIGFGPVLLDYPYLFELDGDKLFCNVTDPITGVPCGGEIDYDAGFNELICKKCGKRYLARDLKRNITENNVIMDTIIGGGKYPMIVEIKRGDEVISKSDSSTDTIVKPHMRRVKKDRFSNKDLNVIIENYRPQDAVNHEETKEEKIIKEQQNTVYVNLDDSDPAKKFDKGFDVVITGGKPIENKRDTNVIVTRGDKPVVAPKKEEEKSDDDDEVSFQSSKSQDEGNGRSSSSDSGKSGEHKTTGRRTGQEVRKATAGNSGSGTGNGSNKNQKDGASTHQVKMKYINKNKKLSAADQVINDKICNGKYYFDENGNLFKEDGSPYKGKNLRLKASDYAPVNDVDDEDY